jgi:hypothetical protein
MLGIKSTTKDSKCRISGSHGGSYECWDTVPYGLYVNRRFGGTYRLHLQGRKLGFFLPPKPYTTGIPAGLVIVTCYTPVSCSDFQP